MLVLSRVRPFASPPGSSAQEFSRQAYWSRQSFPSPGDLPNPGIKFRSPALQVDSLPSESPGKPNYAAAKLLQSCLTLCDPIDGSPPGFPIPAILQARTLEWVAISFSNAGKWKVKVKSLSRVRPSATPWTATFQASPSMGFSRQEYWSGVPLPSLSPIILQFKELMRATLLTVRERDYKYMCVYIYIYIFFFFFSKKQLKVNTEDLGGNWKYCC